MRAKFINETFASPFRKGKKIKWNGEEFYINKVENINNDLDIVNVNGKDMSSKFLLSQGVEIVDEPVKGKWSERKYAKFIEELASENGAENSYDVAINAIYEPGLIDWLKNKIWISGGDETVLERIQWDIEAFL